MLPRKPSPNLIPVSLALNAGIYNALFGMRAGAALVIMDSFQPQEFAELVRRFEIRSTVLPPGAMAMLTDDSAVTDLTPLRYVRSITAPLSPLQARRFTSKFGASVLNSYGQAEIGEVIGWTAADAKEHPGEGRRHRPPARGSGAEAGRRRRRAPQHRRDRRALRASTQHGGRVRDRRGARATGSTPTAT